MSTADTVDPEKALPEPGSKITEAGSSGIGSGSTEKPGAHVTFDETQAQKDDDDQDKRKLRRGLTLRETESSDAPLRTLTSIRGERARVRTWTFSERLRDRLGDRFQASRHRPSSREWQPFEPPGMTGRDDAGFHTTLRGPIHVSGLVQLVKDFFAWLFAVLIALLLKFIPAPERESGSGEVQLPPADAEKLRIESLHRYNILWARSKLLRHYETDHDLLDDAVADRILNDLHAYCKFSAQW